MEKNLSLNGEWEAFYQLPGQEKVNFRGSVPGCAHTDLLREGIIKDIFLDYQSQECQFIENADFVYSTSFTFEGDADGVNLGFSCLDTFCDVILNGKKLGFCDNMFLPWQFDVSNTLRNGENYLEVHFYPPAEWVKDYPEYDATFTTERIHIRRMQCTFGWDWVERFVTMGIMGDVQICRHQETEIDSVYVATTGLDEYGAELYLQASFIKVGKDAMMDWMIIDPQGKTVWSQKRALVEKEVRQRVSLTEPQLWWPNGYGKQPLYILRTIIYDDQGNALQQQDSTFGIRTIRILEAPDEQGSNYWNISKELQKYPHIKEADFNEEYTGFHVLVNGVFIHCKGANWVPCEPFPSAVTEEKCIGLLRLAKEANLTMLRVWGGGVIETDCFYDECDRLGILVTQDFQMACGAYPDDTEDFLKTLQKEAAHITKRLRNHPSLAWWTGDNENSTFGSYDQHQYKGRTAAYVGLEPIVYQYDPYRRFMPSSPFGGKLFMSVTSGNAHGTNFLIWLFEQFRYGDLSDYHKFMWANLSRFNSEIPVFGAPALSSMKRFLSEKYLYEDDCLAFHTKNNPVGMLLEFTIYDAHKTFAEKLLGTFTDEADKLLKLRCIQYEWVRSVMELYRRYKGYTGGALLWMYNDCWPSNSWSVVDYYGNPKAGWYALKNSCEPVTGTIHKEDDEYVLTVMNDKLDKVQGTVKVSLWDVHKQEAELEKEISYSVGANGNVVVDKLDWILSDENQVLVLDVMTETGERCYRTVYFPKRICDLHLEVNQDKVSIVKQDADTITLYAMQYVHMVDLDGDYVFEDNFFTMLPGETRTISMRQTFMAKSPEIELYAL